VLRRRPAVRCSAIPEGPPTDASELAVPWFDAGGRPGETPVVHDRVLTVANAITFVRLLGLPVFVWLVLAESRLTVAFWTLVAIGGTDWIDGYVARKFDQVTKLGRVLDPLIDRALLATAGVTLVVADILPLWVLLVIVVRDVLLLAAAYVLFRGVPDIPVSRTGKLATACLLIGIPCFLLAEIDWVGAGVLGVVGWLYVLAGMVAYYVAAGQYAKAAAALRAQGEQPAGRAS
jgi:cardiolipin synthase (CMP-forming)